MGTFRRKSRETILKLPNLLDIFRVDILAGRVSPNTLTLPYMSCHCRRCHFCQIFTLYRVLQAYASPEALLWFFMKLKNEHIFDFRCKKKSFIWVKPFSKLIWFHMPQSLLVELRLGELELYSSRII